MRKIEEQVSRAFNCNENFRSQNTVVEVVENVHRISTILFLHGNRIVSKIMERNYPSNIPRKLAMRLEDRVTTRLYVSSCGWETRTTKSRLNCIDGVHVTQRSGQWYLNGRKWNGCEVLVDGDEWDLPF